ncbi:MAG TPA: hypothetical protein VFS21_31030 [Roseiflexaceae bacterium]|nr:hypothetical protein [Roseiflexaceae bacterium]
MATEQVQIRVVAATAEAARAAVEQLRAAGAELGEPGQGRRGEWLAYGELSVEVEAAAAPPAQQPARRRSARSGRRSGPR